MEITTIVITGGPCAGKTTAMERIRDRIALLGYTVLFIPETATEFISGGVAPWTCGTNLDYQKCQMELQLEKERLFRRGAATMPKEKILLVCDRGAMDNKVYMSPEDFDALLAHVSATEEQLLRRYDAVFHLVTAAKGNAAHYTTANNAARIETAAEAAALDDKLIAAWSGHPHHRIIGNAESFEEKMDLLIREITAFLTEKRG